MTDAQAGELAREALRAEEPASIRAVLARLKRHTFKSSRVPEREIVLYTQGVLEARLGNLAAAAVPLKKLERQWPRSPFMGEAHALLAEHAIAQKRYKEAEGRLHRALESDMPSERKRKPQELLLWTLVEQDRAREGLAIVQSLRPLSGQEKPSEQGLAAMVEVLASAGERAQTEGALKDFHTLYPQSPMGPRVDLAWGRLLGRSGDPKASAEVFRKLIKDHPGSAFADDARLALANLLTDGSLPDSGDLPSAESLLAEVRKGGKRPPKQAAQVVELRLLVGKSLWEDALDLTDRMDPAAKAGSGEVKQLWSTAWNAWVAERLEKGFAGELLARLKPGAFAALEPKARAGVAELLASQGLLGTLPALLAEAPPAEQSRLRRAALAQVQPEAQPEAVLNLLPPPRRDSPEEALLRARAEGARGRWIPLRDALRRAQPGAARIQALLRLLQRPMAQGESAARRLAEAEGWLTAAPEKGDARQPLAILVGDLRMHTGDPRGALAAYPSKAADPEQRGWVALMRAQALMKLGLREQAREVLKEARDEQGFKGQREALAKSLGS